MNHSPTRVADLAQRTGDWLAQHGDRTTAIVADWAAGPTGSGGPGQINAVSDPTGNTATGDRDPLTQLQTRWIIAVNTLGALHIAYANGRHNDKPATAAHALAMWIRASKPQQRSIHRVYVACTEIEHIIYETMPMDIEAANEEIREKQHLANRATDCQACESPADRIKSGLCIQCYNLEQQWIGRGRADMADRAAVIAAIVGGVSRGEIKRPASPHWLVAVPKVQHEGEVA